MFFLCIHYLGREVLEIPAEGEEVVIKPGKDRGVLSEDPASHSEDYTTIQKSPQIAQVYDLIVVFIRGENMQGKYGLKIFKHL